MNIGREVKREAGVVPLRERLGEGAARLDRKRKREVEGRDQPDHGLPAEFLLRAHSPGVVMHDLAVVVDPADRAVAEGDEEHDPDEAVRKVRPEKRRHRDAEENEGAAHGGRPVLHEMRLRPVRAHGLSEMELLQFPDHPGTECEADHKRRKAGKERAQRQIVEDAEARPAR